MKFLLLLLLSFSAFGFPITQDRITEADQLTVLNSSEITLNNNMDANSNNIFGINNLTVTGLTTLDTGLTGFAKLTAGVVSSQTLIELVTEVNGILPITNGGTGSSTKNFVDLTTNQSIAGVKTFTGQYVAVTTLNGMRPCPVMTLAQRDAIALPSEGDCVVNSTDNELNFYLNASWGKVGGGTELTTKGNLIGFDSIVTKECVLDSTNNYILTNDAASDCGFDMKPAPVSTTLTAKGDIQTHNGVTNTTHVKGTNGQFVVYDDTQPNGLLNTDTLQGRLNPVINSIPYNPIYTGFGTISGNDTYYYRIGEYLHVIGKFISGIPTATTARIDLPIGLNIDDAKIATSSSVGRGSRAVGSADNNDFSILYISGNTDHVRIGQYNNAANHPLDSRQGSELVVNGNVISFNFSVPIVGWTSGVDAIAQNKALLYGRYYLNGNQSIVTSGTIAFNTKETGETGGNIDASFNTTTGEFTSPIDSCFEFVSGVVAINSGTNSRPYIVLKVNGTDKAYQSDGLGANTNTLHNLHSGVLCLVTNDIVKIDMVFGSTRDVEGLPTTFFSIKEIPNSFTIAAAIDSQKWDCETKFLTADVSAIGNISDLVFTVVVGKKYQVIGQVNSAANTSLYVVDNTTTLARAYIQNGTSIIGITTSPFTAASTTIAGYKDSTNGTFGNGLKDETWLTLCKLPDNYITL